MPSLIFLRRSWSFASDDFVFPAIFDMISRLFCVILMAFPLFFSNPTSCVPSVPSKIFLAFLFLLQITGALIDVLLSRYSARGGVMEVEERSKVPMVLLIILFLSIAEILIHCVNIYTFSLVVQPCGETTVGLFIAGNAVRLIHILHGYVWLLLHFRRSGVFWSRLDYENQSVQKGYLSRSNDDTVELEARAALSNSVERKLNKLLAVKSPSKLRTSNAQDSQEHAAVDSAAKLFSELFYDVNLVASDIVAGLLLLRWQTFRWVGCGHRIPVGWIKRESVPCNSLSEISPRKHFHHGDATLSKSFIDPSNWLSIQHIRRMAQIAISVYGSFFYYCLYRSDRNVLCRLCRHLPCLPCCRSRSGSNGPASYKADCCFCSGKNCDMAAVLELTGLKLSDFVSINFDNTVFESPYFVAIDDEYQRIVVAVRGTLSVEDAIVDLLCDGVRLEEVESSAASHLHRKHHFVGHRGMVNSARKLFNRLIQEGAIQRAKSKHPDYSLVICGHSLGAGIASFLTLLLRPLYPEVKGYAMSAPLGTMNSELAEYCKPFLVSVIYGFDAFARMNVATVVDLKWRLIDALSGCHVPKYRLLKRGFELSVRRCCYLGCCKRCCHPPPTVGQDTKLFDPPTQQRLTHPLGPAPAQPSPSGRGDSAVDDAWPSRLYHGDRTLLRWLDPSKLMLFSATQPKTHHRSEHGDGPEELRNGTFGGLVLHIVDVDMGTSELSEFQPFNPSREIGWPPFLFNEHVRCCSMKFRSEVTVAVWTTSEQFQTLLVHPRMFTDHTPHDFYRAVNRVYAQAVSTQLQGALIDQSDVFRRLL